MYMCDFSGYKHNSRGISRGVTIWVTIILRKGWSGKPIFEICCFHVAIARKVLGNAHMDYRTNTFQKGALLALFGTALFKKMNILFEYVAKCLKLIWNHSGIISGAYFSPFQGVYYLYRGLRRAPKPYFGLILEYWIIFLFFSEWIFFWISWTLLNEYFFEWIFWILFWIEFWIESFLGPIQWKNEFSKHIEQG